MEPLHIPYIPQLDDATDADELERILDMGGARRTIDSVNWSDRYPYHPLTTFTIAHSGSAIYIDFFVRCNYLKAENFTDQSPVCQDSCVEFFVQPRIDDVQYWNFEFNCIGAVNASRRRERRSPVRLTSQEIARIRRYPSCGTRPFCELEGLFSWSLLVVIPLDMLGVDYEAGKPIEMRANFNKCASGTSQPHYVTWMPIPVAEPDFHRPEYFGSIVLDR